MKPIRNTRQNVANKNTSAWRKWAAGLVVAGCVSVGGNVDAALITWAGDTLTISGAADTVAVHAVTDAAHTDTIDGSGGTVTTSSAAGVTGQFITNTTAGTHILTITENNSYTIDGFRGINAAGYAGGAIQVGTLDGSGNVTAKTDFVLNHTGTGTLTFSNNSASGPGAGGGAIGATGDVTLLSGKNVFSKNTVTLTNPAGQGGGGAIASNGNVIISGGNNSFTENSVTGTKGLGGAILALGSVTISDGTNSFTKNTAGLTGGAIHAQQVLISSANRTTFTENKSGTSTGGAIRIDGNTITAASSIAKADFSKNEAEYGGAIFTNRALTVSDSTFSENISSVSNKAAGGAIFTDAALTISGSTFTGNSVTSTNSATGGAVIVNAKNVAFASGPIAVAISGSTFTGNTVKATNAASEAGGGGLFVQGDLTKAEVTATLADVIFDGNTAEGGLVAYGGGLTISGVKGFTYTGASAGKSEIKNNSITSASGGSFADGGGLYINKIGADGVAITGVAINGNTATATTTGAARGGGVFIDKTGSDSAATFTFTDTSFTGNKAIASGTASSTHYAEGGAIWTNADITIKAVGANVAFSGNTTSVNGVVTNNDIHLEGGATGTFDADSGKTITLGGGISGGSGSVVKTGLGTLTFTKDSISDYAGTTTISGGRMVVETGAKFAKKAATIVDGATSVLELQEGADFTDTNNLALTLNDGGTLALTQGTGKNDVSSILVITLAGTGGKIDVASGMDATALGVISGTKLTKTGNGTLTLSANNNYTGGTTINAGTVKVGHVNAFGTTGVTLTGNAAISMEAGTPITITNAIDNGGKVLTVSNDDATHAFTLGGVISGNAGSLVKTGDGTIILSGANTYRGGTAISAGTLEVTGSLYAAGKIDIAENSTLEMNRTTGGNQTLSGVISGKGSLVNTAGTLTLLGKNTYTGGTTINAGIVLVGNDSAFGNGDVTISGSSVIRKGDSDVAIGNNIIITDAATTLTLDNRNTDDKLLTFSGTISGAGALTKTREYTVKLAGDNTYTGKTTVSAGTLEITGTLGYIDASTTAKYAGAIAINGTTTILSMNQGGDQILSGNITGTGSLTKDGSGTLILNGANTYNGLTTINLGTVEVGDAKAFGTSAVTIGGTATIQKGNAGNAIAIANNITFSGQQLTLNNTDTKEALNLSGTLTGGGTGTLIKDGSGEVKVSDVSVKTLAVNAGTLTAGNVVIASGGLVDLKIDATNPTMIDATSIDFNHSSLNITGYTADDTKVVYPPATNPQTVITTTTGVSNFSNVVTVSGQTSVDFLSATAEKVGNNVVVSTGLTWYSTAGDKDRAHGTFTLIAADSKFTLGANLNDVAANAVNGWNGKTLTKDGAGTLILTGANTYTGGTTIAAGTVLVGHATAFGATAGKVTLTGAATIGKYETKATTDALIIANTVDTAGKALILHNDDSDSLTFTGGIASSTTAGALEKTGAGTVILSGSSVNTFADVKVSEGVLANNSDKTFTTGNISITGAKSALQLGAGSNNAINGAISVTTDGTLEIATGAKFTGKIDSLTLDAGTLKLTGTGTADTPVGVTLGTGGGIVDVVDVGLIATQHGVVTGDGSLEKTGNGTLVLAKANTYTGGTMLNAGTIVVGDDKALGEDDKLGSGSSALTIGGKDTTLARDKSTTDRILGNDIDLDVNALTVDNEFATNGEFTLTGDITGDGSLIKTGEGTLVLSGANTYEGGTTIAAGTVLVGSDTAFGDAAGDVKLTGAATIGKTTDSAALTIANAVDTKGNALTLTNADADVGDTLTFTGGITGTGALEKTGAGTVILGGSSVNTFGTVTVSGGVLENTSTGTFTTGKIDVTGASSVLRLGAGSTNAIVGAISVSGGGTLEIAEGAQFGNKITGLTLDAGTLKLTGTGDVITPIGVTLGTGGGIVNVASGLTATQNGVVTGDGSLEKTGNGTLVLAKANDYKGGTTLNAGTIVVGNDDALGSGGLKIDGKDTTLARDGGKTDRILDNDIDLDSYALTVENALAANGEFMLDGKITGDGSLKKTGLGTLVLSGANTYTGGTTINAGTLQIGSGSTTGSITGDVVNNAKLAFNRSNDSTYAGAVSGTGSLVKDGAGTLTLSGTNTYSGGTTINAGTLQIGNGGITGSIVGNVLNNATLAFNRSDAVAFAGVISGSGSLVKDGSGKLTLSGANTYTGGTTISAGMLEIGNGSTTGSIVGNVLNNATLAFNRSDAVAFDGVISGSGSLTKDGAGSLTLSGANDYSGGTNISGGTLSVTDAKSVGTGAITLMGNNATLQVTGPVTTTFANAIVIADDKARINIGNSGANVTFSGAITGSKTLNKIGGGTLILSGDSSAFAGKFAQNVGNVALTSTAQLGGIYTQVAGTTLTSQNGATLGDATFAGIVEPTGTLTVASAEFNTATINLTTLNTDKIVSTGAITFTGPVHSTINVNTSAIGEYTLITSTSNGIVNNNNVNIFNAATLAGQRTGIKSNAAEISYKIFAAGATPLTWTGAHDGKWDSKTINWKDANDFSMAFADDDNVTFDSTGSHENYIAVATGGVTVGTMAIDDDYSFTGGQITAKGAVNVAAGKSLGLVVSDDVALSAKSVNFNTTGILNIAGYDLEPDEFGTPKVVITTTNGVSNFDPSIIQIMDHKSVDFLSASAAVVGNNIEVTTVLTWYSTAAIRPAHGTFTLENIDELFTLGTKLENNSVNLDPNWNGKTLTKKGLGNLILSAKDSIYTDGTFLNAGTITIGASSELTADGKAIEKGPLGRGALKIGGKDTTLASTNNDAYTLHNNIDLDSYALTFDNADTSTLQIEGVVSGVGGSIIKAGDGTLVLNGKNTYDKGTTLNAGTIVVGNDDALGTKGLTIGDKDTTLARDNSAVARTITNNIVLGANALTVDNAAKGAFTLAGNITGTGSLIKTGDGSLVLTGDNKYTNGTQLNAGTIVVGHNSALGTGALTIDSDVTTLARDNSAAPITLTNIIDLDSYALTVDNSNTTANGEFTLGGAITGVDGSLIKTGAGTLVLAGANTYSGGTKIVDGTVLVGSNTAFGDDDAGDVTLTGAATIGRTVNASGTPAPLTIANVVDTDGHALTLTNADADAGDTLTFTSGITGAGTLTKTGVGTVILAGANAYTGGTTITGGTLALLNGGSIAASSGVNLTAGTFNISGITAASTAIKSLAGTGGTVALGVKNLTVGDASSTSFAGNITGTGMLTKTGAGTLTLSGNSSSFAGTFTQNAGGVALTSAANLGGTYTQVAGTTLTSQNGATLNDAIFAGIITPSGTLNVKTATFNSATINLGSALNTNNITATGAITFNTSTINVDTNDIGTYKLISTTTGTITGSDIVNAEIVNAADLTGKRYSYLYTNTDISYKIFEDVASLTWTGTTNGNWDFTTINNWVDEDAHSTKFDNGDSVTFGVGPTIKDIIITGTGVKVDKMTVNDSYNFSGGKITATGAVTVAAGKSLGIDVTNVPVITAASMDFNNSTLNITGYTPGTDVAYNAPLNVQTVITTTGGVSNFNSAVTVAGQATADFLSASAYLDGTDVKVETRLTWYSTDPNRKAHGDFEITTGNSFELGAVLKDNDKSTNLASTWDGKTLTKLGDGTLILTGANTYTGGTTIEAGTILVGHKNAFGANAVTLTGDATIGKAGTLAVSNNLVIANAVVTNGNALTLTNAYNGSLLTFTGGIAGVDVSGKAGAIAKTGAGAVILGGTTANTFADVEVSGGVLANDSTGVFTTGEISVDGKGSTLRLGATSTNAIDGAISVSGGGTLEIANGADFTQSTISGLTLDAGTLKLTGDGDVNTLVGVTLGAGGGTVDVASKLTATQHGNVGNVTGVVGSLTKTGAGTLVLAGTNSYSGGTTVSGGTLQIGDGGATGSIAGNVLNNATIAFNRSDALTFGGVISGTGAVTKEGEGTLTLTGVNTYAGETKVNAGTLALSGAGAVASSSKVNLAVAGAGVDISGITAAGTVVKALYGTDGTSVALGGKTLTIGDASNADSSYAGVIGSTGGSLIKRGTGTLTLSGANTYTGGTTINAGTVEVGNASAFGSGAVTLSGNATIGKTTTSGAISIANNISIVAGYNLTLNNADIVADTLDFAGIITGSGSLEKAGAGTVILSGNNTYTGKTTVSAGNLDIAGNFTARDNVIVKDTGNLSIVGNLALATAKQLDIASGGTVTVASGGVLSVEASSASVSVTPIVLDGGMFTVASGGTLRVLINKRDLPGVVGGETEFMFVDNKSGNIVNNGSIVIPDISKFFNREYVYGNGHITVRRLAASEVFPLVSDSVAASLDSYNINGVNRFMDAVFEDEAGLTNSENIEFAYNMAGVDGGAYRVAALSQSFQSQLGQRLSTPMVPYSSTSYTSEGEVMYSVLGQSSDNRAKIAQTVWASPFANLQSGRDIESGGLRYDFASDMYGAMVGYEARTRQQRGLWGIAGLVGGGKGASDGTNMRTSSTYTIGGVGAYSKFNYRGYDLVGQGGIVGSGGDVKQNQNGIGNLSANTNVAAIYMSLGFERKMTTIPNRLYVVPTVSIDYTNIYQWEFTTKFNSGGGDTDAFKSDAGSANILSFPVGVKMFGMWRLGRPGSWLSGDAAFRFIPSLADKYMNYSNLPVSGVAANLRSAVADEFAFDLNTGLTWRYNTLEFSTRYNTLVSERFTNHNLALVFSKSF